MSNTAIPEVQLKIVKTIAGELKVNAAQVAATVPHVTQVEIVAERNSGVAECCLLVHGAGREQTPQLLQALLAAAIAVYRVEPDDPSLEDVYFALEHS